MLAARTCSDCGAELPKDAVLEHCPKCSAEIPSPVHAKVGGARHSETKISAGQSFGDYELLAEIARGGMGVVFKARQINLNRVVALKMIRDSRLASPQTVQRFRVEAEAAAKLDHPQIVPIYEVGQCDGQNYFTMRLIEGTSLANELRGTPMDAARVAILMAVVARAIHYAHQRGVLHRDLKPANVLLDVHGQPHITDFGLAKLSDRDAGLTSTAEIMGSPNYMSPEQAAGRPEQNTTAADVYSLGAIMYELLTGRAPFRADTPMETLRKVLHEEPVRPRVLYKFAEPDLETICLKCMEKDPARRYGSAQALAEDLERWARHEPIQARPVTAIERARKWTRRNPKVAALLIVIHVVVGLGLAGVLWMSWRVTEANKVITAKATESHQRLVRMNVASGERLVEDEDRFRGLLCFTEALRLEQGDPAREEIHRYRIESVLQHSPKLAQIFFHDGPVEFVEFSPDGERLATGSGDRSARVWNVATGEPITRPLSMNARVDVAKFSPDGKRIVTMARNGVARLWDSFSGEPLSPPLKPGAFQSVSSRFSPAASFSGDGHLLLTAFGSKTAQIWSGVTGERLVSLEHPDIVYDAGFSPDGRRVITGCKDGTARIWDAASGKEIGPVLRHTNLVAWVAFSPDGARVLTVCDRRTVQVWNPTTGRPVGQAMNDGQVLLFVSFTRDSRRVLTAGWNNTVRTWSAATGNILTRFNHGSGIMNVAFNPRNKHFASACWDGTTIVWDEVTGLPTTALLPQGAAVLHVAFSSDGRYLATAGRNGTVRVWDLAAGNSIVQTFAHRMTVWAEFSPDERYVVTTSAGTGHDAWVWDTATGKPVGGPLRHNDVVLRATFSADGRHLVTASEDGTACVWEIPSGDRAIPPLKHGKPVRTAMFSPDGARVLTACDDGCGRIWDVTSGTESLPALQHENAVTCAAFSRDGKLIVTTSKDSTAQIWSAATGRPLAAPLPHNGEVKFANFSRDASRLVTIYTDTGRPGDSARVWDVAAGQPVTPPLKHDAPVSYSEFSPDGHCVVTASDDGTVKIWNAMTGQPVTPPLRHHSGAKQAIFSPDGRRVATGTETGVVQIWDAATGEAVSLPFKHATRNDQMHLQFSGDGQRLLIASGGDGAWIRQLARTQRSVDELMLQAQVLSGHCIDPVAGLVPLEDAAFKDAWQKLRSKQSNGSPSAPRQVGR